jgi:hypothetical protein
MLKEILKKHITSQASYVEYGYGQVEPNHLSAQRTAQIYAQLPADPAIDVLEQGQFVKYDYASGLVNFTGAGEWMLVYNEIKLYREHQLDCEFAMIKGNYQARVYSPLDGNKSAEEMYGPTRLLQGNRERWDGEKFVTEQFNYNGDMLDALPVIENGKIATIDGEEPADDKSNWKFADYSVASKVHDYYEMNDINNPEIAEDYRRRLFMKLRAAKNTEAMMPNGTTMVPRVFKTNVGDIFTTNTIHVDVDKDGIATPEGLAKIKVGEKLKVGANGILELGEDDKMTWQIVKVYTMPDHQRGVKIMRIV